jgi:hypothetical protein
MPIAAVVRLPIAGRLHHHRARAPTRAVMRFTSALLSLALALVAPGARAYTLCTSPAGTPVRWDGGAVHVVVDDSVSSIHPDAFAAVSAAFATWQAVPGTVPPPVVIEHGTADALGYRPGDSGNQSTVRYVVGESLATDGGLAITVVTADTTGAILDADVVISGAPQRPFTVLGAPVPAGSPPPGAGAYDLQDVITHEAGHFLGFGDERSDHAATMYLYSARGETTKRELERTDIDGMHALYDAPPSRTVVASCATRSGPAPSAGWLGFVATLGLGLAAAALAARGRARRGLFAGGTLAVLAAGVAVGPAMPASDAADRQGADAVAEVTRAEPRWQGGLIVTHLALSPRACRAAGCPAGELETDVLGGTLDGLVQIVGHRRVPAIGATVPLDLRAGGLVVPPGALPPRLAR